MIDFDMRDLFSWIKHFAIIIVYSWHVRPLSFLTVCPVFVFDWCKFVPFWLSWCLDDFFVEEARDVKGSFVGDINSRIILFSFIPSRLLILIKPNHLGLRCIRLRIFPKTNILAQPTVGWWELGPQHIWHVVYLESYTIEPMDFAGIDFLLGHFWNLISNKLLTCGDVLSCQTDIVFSCKHDPFISIFVSDYSLNTLILIILVLPFFWVIFNLTTFSSCFIDDLLLALRFKPPTSNADDVANDHVGILDYEKFLCSIFCWFEGHVWIV